MGSVCGRWNVSLSSSRYGQFFKGKLCNFVSLLGGTFIPWSWLHSETGRRLEPKLIVSSFEWLCLGYFVNAIEVFPSNSNGWPRCPFISDIYIASMIETEKRNYHMLAQSFSNVRPTSFGLQPAACLRRWVRYHENEVMTKE
jgi:hypothetical protein